MFHPTEPLAARMRPRNIDECVGQEHLLPMGRPLGDAIRRGDVGSVILWGPPGSGKTTLAMLIARYADRHFVAFSAVTEGIPRIRQILKEAEAHRQLGQGTIVFCDEIHRFNTAQQDALLPHVEQGLITLIGATTQNPSFALNGALLSRCRVFVLEPLRPKHLEELIRRAFGDGDRGLSDLRLQVDDEAVAFLAVHADGDARRALSVIESAAQHVGPGGRITHAVIAEVLARRVPAYDRDGERHYNSISALHKAVRGSDPQGALYWLARMLEGGEDPLYLARRLVRIATEDVGLADPRALTVALAAKEAYVFLGTPEGELALAEALVYLATAPKSNTVYMAWQNAVSAARETPALDVPLHLRNASTPLMQALGYGRGYAYDHEAPGGIAPQTYLPEELAGRQFYVPGATGFEQRIAERVRWWEQRRQPARPAGDPAPVE
ncbi:MAG: replication-associated recombination protein A [Gemmatimonadota bacterium]|nr:replication-associated recombination protein A [Gemmatimonadota bacterium]